MAKIKPRKTIKKRQKPKPTSKPASKPAPPKLNIKEEKKDGGPVDEKGNPFPIENPEGGDPICVGGYKIDYDFDFWNDPINPPFRCIQALKDPTDGIAEKMMKMANNPSTNVINATTGNIPGVGGGGRSGRSGRSSRPLSKKIIRSHSRHNRRRTLRRRTKAIY
jgi:outer membrane biosynthesis protein TonB